MYTHFFFLFLSLSFSRLPSEIFFFIFLEPFFLFSLIIHIPFARVVIIGPDVRCYCYLNLFTYLCFAIHVISFPFLLRIECWMTLFFIRHFAFIVFFLSLNTINLRRREERSNVIFRLIIMRLIQCQSFCSQHFFSAYSIKKKCIHMCVDRRPQAFMILFVLFGFSVFLFFPFAICLCFSVSFSFVLYD